MRRIAKQNTTEVSEDERIELTWEDELESILGDMMSKGGDLAELPRKTCSTCNKSFPLHQDYFHRDVNQPDGFKASCVGCRNLNARIGQVSQAKKEIEKFSEKYVSLIADAAMQVQTSTGRRDNIGKLYESIVSALGGTQMVSAIYATTIAEANPNVRARLLTTLTKMSERVTEMGLADKNLEDMSYEELMEEVERKARGAGLASMSDAAIEHMKKMQDKQVEMQKQRKQFLEQEKQRDFQEREVSKSIANTTNNLILQAESARVEKAENGSQGAKTDKQSELEMLMDFMGS